MNAREPQTRAVRIVASRAWVPTLWRLEVANSLQFAVRRKRIDAAFRDASLADLGLLNIQVDPDTANFAWGETLRLAHTYDLTLHDAAYLELARRLSLPLASQDKSLRLGREEVQGAAARHARRQDDFALTGTFPSVSVVHDLGRR